MCLTASSNANDVLTLASANLNLAQIPTDRVRLRNTCYHIFLERLIRISGARFVYREDYCLDEIVLNVTVSVIG